MSDDSQHHPLAPAAGFGRSDEESLRPTTFSRQETKTSKWLIHVLVTIVITSTVLLTFSIVFLRVKSPSVKLTSVTITNLESNNSSLSMTMNGTVRMKNTNLGKFVTDTQSTTAIVMYDGVVIGHGGVGVARVKSNGEESVGVVFEVDSSGLLNANQSRDLEKDFEIGILELRGFAKFSGRVHLLDGSVKKRDRPELNCTMNVNFTSKAVQDLVCR